MKFDDEMQLPWQNLEGFSGATAVGSVVFVDFAIIADSFADNLFPVINLYSQTPTWAIVVSIPLLSLAYLIGVLSMGFGELALSLMFRRAATARDDDATLLEWSDAIIGKHQRLLQEAQLFSGSFIAFGLLAVGSILHAVRIDGWKRFLIAVAIFAFLFATTSALLAFRSYAATHRIAGTTGRTIR